MSLSQRIIQRPVAVTMFYVAVLLLGVISLSRLPVDLLPDLAYPRLTVQTQFKDAPPEEVERLVSQRIEAVMATVPGLRNISSVSSEGLSIVTLEFAWGQNMDFAALHVREKLDRLGRFAEGVDDPAVARQDPASQPFMGLSITGAEDNLPRLADLARDVIKRRLEQIDGVALAQVSGAPVREIHVDLDADRLQHLGITISEVTGAIEQSNHDLPGGTLLRGRYRFSLRTLGAFQSTQDMESVVIRHEENGHRVLLRDVATVRNSFRETESVTRYNGSPSIGVLLQKESGANTVQVARTVHEVLDELRARYPEAEMAVAFNQARFIQQAIQNLLMAVALGGILAFLVLFLFLHDARHPLAVGIAIPIAVIATFTLLHFFGVTLNLMSLGGLALGVGMLVDASIVVLENIFRHHEEGHDLHSAAVKGSREVAMAVTASTFTTIAVFMPVLYVKGVAGQLFKDQALTVTFSLLASLLVSLTLLPVMAARFRKPPQHSSGADDFSHEDANALWRRHRWLSLASWPLRMLLKFLHHVLGGGLLQMGRWLAALFRATGHGLSRLTAPLFRQTDRFLEAVLSRYEFLLEWALARRGLTLGIFVAALIVTALLGLTLDRELMPKVDQGEFTARLLLEPGTGLEAVSQSARRMEESALGHPLVLQVFSRIGRISGQNDEAALSQAELRIRVKPGAPTAEVMNDLEQDFSAIAGQIILENSQSLMGQMLGQAGGDVEIRIICDNLDEALALVDTVQALAGLAGLVNLSSATALARPEIRLQIDRGTAGQYGLSVYQVAQFVRQQVAGTIAGQFKAFDQKIDIWVRPEAAAALDMHTLLDRSIPTASAAVPLRELLTLTPGKGATAILRDNQARLLRLTGQVQGRGLGQAVADAEKRLAPLGHNQLRIEIGGAREEMQESYHSLGLAALLAGALVFMIMAAQFESLRHPLVILFSIPMAGIGTIWLLFLTGQSINVIALIGVVVLVGIAVNDAIVKVDFINQSRRQGMGLHEALITAGRKRFRPIVMTSVTTILGLLPLAIGLGEGSELQRPLAIAIIGGLVTSTGLTLICIPVLYSLFEQRHQPYFDRP